MKFFSAFSAMLLLTLAQAAEATIAELRTRMQDCTPAGCFVYYNYGTTVCVGRDGQDWIFVATGHQVHGVFLQKAQVKLGGTWVPIQYVGDDFGLGTDISVWRLRSNYAKLEAFDLVNAAQGEKAQHIGKDDGGWKHYHTRVSRITPDYLYTEHPAIQGHSGGPIFNGRRQVTGIICMTDDDVTLSVPAAKVCRTVRRHCPSYTCRCDRPKPRPRPAPPPPKDAPAPPPPADNDAPAPPPAPPAVADCCKELEERLRELDLKVQKLHQEQDAALRDLVKDLQAANVRISTAEKDIQLLTKDGEVIEKRVTETEHALGQLEIRIQRVETTPGGLSESDVKKIVREMLTGLKIRVPIRVNPKE